MFRSYAVVPAAGRSVRMGRHKLLMPWSGGTLIEHVLSAWLSSRVTHVVVVVRADDARLRDVCLNVGVDVLVPEVAPPEMRVSVQGALRYVQEQQSPQETDVWMLAPADMPGLSARLIDTVLEAHDPDAPAILVPTQGTKRGHPVLFPWSLAGKVGQLSEHAGVNALFIDNPVRSVDCVDTASFQDVDTPADVERLRGPE
ncbi:MAG: NTP transferase domain-containing protein [Pirellulaceae bacterium]